MLLRMISPLILSADFTVLPKSVEFISSFPLRFADSRSLLQSWAFLTTRH